MGPLFIFLSPYFFLKRGTGRLSLSLLGVVMVPRRDLTYIGVDNIWNL